MSSNVMEANLALQKATVDAAGLYCRVLELQIKAVAEGASPLATGKIREITSMAVTGLQEELELLRCLRTGLIDEARETGSPGRK